jgi:bacterioferritin-associated ferredoxin
MALSGHCTADQVAEKCGAGSCCGGCRPAIEEIIEQVNPSQQIDLSSFRESA